MALTLAGFVGIVALELEVVSAYIPRGPIYILGNAGFAVENGTSGGSGSPSDPYIIEGWEIDASTARGIWIRNTVAHFIIRDVYVHSGLSNFEGVYLENVANGRLEYANVSDNLWGNVLSSSNDISVIGNSMWNNWGRGGIFVSASYNVSIAGNRLDNSVTGISIESSSNVSIANNNVSHAGGGGMVFSRSDNLSVTGNTVWASASGIRLDYSTNATISGNTFISTGIFLNGATVSHYNSHTIKDNLVNGKPLRYEKDCNGLLVDNVPIGQLIVANCRNVVASRLRISDTDVGIEIAYGDGIALRANDVSATYWHGFYLDHSTNISVADNTISRLTWGYGTGVDLTYATNVSLAGNVISDGAESAIRVAWSEGVSMVNNTAHGVGFSGIHLALTNDISIIGNEISASRNWAIYYDRVENASVHHNGLLVSLPPWLAARDDRGSENAWDDGYPSGGNYWSDYTAVDSFSGPNQDIPGSDGIGDTPYVLDADSRDRYPLVDAASPSISITSPSEGQSVSASRVDVRGTASDTGYSFLDRVEVRVNGGAWEPANGTVSWLTSVDLRLGANLIEGVAWDNAGNLSPSASLNLTFEPNTPPTASFTMSPTSGSVTTLFEIDASSSTDTQDPSSAIEVRWDWEDDGVWDTPWTTANTALHKYENSGTYTIRLEARDTGGMTSNATRQIVVSESTGPISDGAGILPAIMLLALIVLMVGVVLFFIFRRRRRPTAIPNSTQKIDEGPR